MSKKKLRIWETICTFANDIYKEMEQTVFELELLEEARDFLKSQTKEIRGKIGYNIRRVQKGERDKELFKKLDGTDIWEFRTIYNKVCYRLFAFWDSDINTLVVATHGAEGFGRYTTGGRGGKVIHLELLEDARDFFDNKKQ